MQPYFFPYIGYFQLINAVDKFIFYDDVNYINRGWVNRNKILINNEPRYLTVSLKEASQNKTINQIEFIDNRYKMLKTIQMAYTRAPYFKDAFPVIEECFNLDTICISALNIYSIQKVCHYLEIKTIFERSGRTYPETKPLGRTERVVSICKTNNVDTYINAIGGKEIYSKQDFENQGVKLLFLKPEIVEYTQYWNLFLPWLSIIDVIMFNKVSYIKEMLNHYKLE